MPTYEFKQPDGSYQSKTVDTDMSNTAGYLSGNIRAVQTVAPQAVTPVTPAVTPVTPTTPATPTNPTPTTPTVTTQTTPTPTNKRIKINNPAALAQGTTLTANDIIKEGNDIYLKAGVAIPKGQESYFSMVDSPIKTGATASNILPQNTLQNVSGDMTREQELTAQRSKMQDVINSFFTQDNTADNNAIIDVKNRLSDIKNAIRNKSDDVRKLYAGRDVTESQLQAIIGKETEPLARQEQYLVEQVNTLVSSLQQKASDSRANAQLAMQYDANLTNELNNIQEQARQGKIDELNILTTMLQMPEGTSYTMSDGTVLQGKKKGDIQTTYQTDNAGNVTAVSFNPSEVADSIAKGEKPKFYTTDLGKIGAGYSLSEVITADQNGYSFDENGNPIKKKIITSQSGNSYDLSTYATDPNHANAIQNILNRIGKFTDPSQIDSYIKAVAPNSPITSDMILTASNQYNVGWEELVALMQQESQLGTAGKGARLFNPANVGNTDSGAERNYKTWQSGVNAGAEQLARRITMPTVEEYVNKDVASWAEAIQNKTAKLTDVKGATDKETALLKQQVINYMNQNPIKNEAASKALQENIKLVDDILNDKHFDSVVSPNALARASLFNKFTGAKQTVIGKIEQLISNEALNSLINAKKQGATFGALSDRELDVLANAATFINQLKVVGDKGKNKGKVLGYKANEQAFKDELKKLQNSYNILLNAGTIGGNMNQSLSVESILRSNPAKIDEYNTLVSTYPDYTDEDILTLMGY